MCSSPAETTWGWPRVSGGTFHRGRMCLLPPRATALHVAAELSRAAGGAADLICDLMSFN